LNEIGIIVIRNEILDGIVLDTNTQWIIQQLKQLNVRADKPYGERGIRLWVSAHGESLGLIKKRVKKITNLLVELTKDQVD
jgi:hypothetical protein